MPTLSVVENYRDDTTPTQQQLDAAFDSVESFFNSTGIAADNISAASIATANIDDLSATTGKFATNAVTSNELKSSVGTDSNRAVTTDSIRNLAVTTAKLAPTIPNSKFTGGLYAVSSSCGVPGLSDGVIAIPNLTLGITTTGRPLKFILQPDGSANSAGVYTFNPVCWIALYRNGALIQKASCGDNFSWTSDGTGQTYVFYDSPPAGTYTYTIVKSSAGGSWSIRYYVVAYREL